MSISGNEALALFDEIDDEVVVKVEALGFSRNDILHAVSLGPDLLTDGNHPFKEKFRPIAVSYHLLLNEFRKQITSKTTP